MFIKCCVTAGAVIVASGMVVGLNVGTVAAASYTTAAGATVDSSVTQAGATMIVRLKNFVPNEHISGDLHSTVVHVFDVTVDNTGATDVPVTIPDKFDCGSHEIVATGDANDVSIVGISVGGNCAPVGPNGPATDNNPAASPGNGNIVMGDRSCTGLCNTDPADPAFGKTYGCPECDHIPVEVDPHDTNPTFGSATVQAAGLGAAGVLGTVLPRWRRRHEGD